MTTAGTATAHRWFLSSPAEGSRAFGLWVFVSLGLIPYNPAIGVKLVATPWTDANLQHVEGISTEQLRQKHRAKGMPESLVEVLHLAALTDVRMLVFVADAPVLDGLPLYDDD